LLPLDIAREDGTQEMENSNFEIHGGI